MPGAQLTNSADDRHEGTVTVRVGPMKVTYQGVATLREFDSIGRRANLVAEGRETKGQGHARAVVHSSTAAQNGSTQLSVMTDLEVTGRVAQFGRGLLQDVLANLLGEFAQRVAKEIHAEEEVTGASPGPPGPEAVSQKARDQPPAMGAFALVAGPVARRVVPVLVALVVVCLLVRWRGSG
jgi:uncharacterized protein